MLTKDNKDILKELNAISEQGQLLKRLLSLEKKYKKNTLTIYMQQLNYSYQFRGNKDFQEWISCAEKYLKNKCDLELINTQEKIDKICLIGNGNQFNEEKILKIKNSIIFVYDTNEKLSKLIYLASQNNNFIYIYTDDIKLSKKYKNENYIQCVMTKDKHKKVEMLKNSDLYLLLSNEEKNQIINNFLRRNFKKIKEINL